MMLNLCIYLALIEDESDQLTFRDVCNNYKEMMFDIAMGMTKDYYDAQDAISIALYSIARSIKNINYSDEKRTKAYICKIVKNATYDVLRKKQRTNQVYSLDDFEDMSYTESLTDSLDGDEQYKAIVRLIHSMPELYRDILTLYYLHDLTITVISKSLGRPISTVRKQLNKGTDMLKKILREEHFHE